MIHWLISVEVAPSQRTGSQARKFYGCVLNELEKLDVIDADLTGEIQKGPVHISIATEIKDMATAMIHGITAIRSAISAAGGATPGWPTFDDINPEPDGKGKWVVHFTGSTQKVLTSV